MEEIKYAKFFTNYAEHCRAVEAVDLGDTVRVVYDGHGLFVRHRLAAIVEPRPGEMMYRSTFIEIDAEG